MDLKEEGGITMDEDGEEDEDEEAEDQELWGILGRRRGRFPQAWLSARIPCPRGFAWPLRPSGKRWGKLGELQDVITRGGGAGVPRPRFLALPPAPSREPQQTCSQLTSRGNESSRRNLGQPGGTSQGQKPRTRNTRPTTTGDNVLNVTGGTQRGINHNNAPQKLFGKFEGV